MQSLGLGTPGQNAAQQSGNIQNAINQGFQNNTQAVNNSLDFLTKFLGQNPSPVSLFGNIGAGPQFGNGVTLGGGATNSLGALTQPTATASALPTMPAQTLPPALAGAARTAPAIRPNAPPPPAGGSLALMASGAPQMNHGMPVYNQLTGAPGPNPSYQFDPNANTYYFNGASDIPSEAVASPSLANDFTLWQQKWGGR